MLPLASAPRRCSTVHRDNSDADDPPAAAGTPVFKFKFPRGRGIFAEKVILICKKLYFARFFSCIAGEVRARVGKV